MKLQPDETRITGVWVVVGGKVEQDTSSERIEYLVSHVLELLASSKQYGAWETLFRDPGDGRLWERTYPQGELQGGGAPQLALILRDDAERKYGRLTA